MHTVESDTYTVGWSDGAQETRETNETMGGIPGQRTTWTGYQDKEQIG